MHDALDHSQLSLCVWQAHESMKEDKTYSSISAVPGNMAELLEVEEERFTAAALFGLSGSDVGIREILSVTGTIEGELIFLL